MPSPSALQAFIAQAVARSRERPEPADCVLALAPLMLELIEQAGSFLEPQHYRSSPIGYSRNLIFDLPDESLSLYAIVWLPGQWTPVHDHGSWGVVGVLEERGSMLGENLDNLAIAPARSPLQTLTSRRGVVSQVVIQAVNPDLLLDAKAEVEGIMRVRRQLRPAELNDFSIETVDETLSFWDRISTILFLALPGLVAISLVVGGIVIMNIMLVSVMERTREIGVRKALGARRRDILTQVIIESATLSTVGAALGVAAGGGLAMLVRALSPLPAAVDPKWVTLGVALGMTVGIVAGVYPASRASRMDPVEALRYE
jgi:putative ABC transport system permease protein